jgi:hypothetical protein
MISDLVILSVLIYLLEISVSMISHTVILSVLINLLENISQYDISISEIVSIDKPTGKYQSVYDISQ